MQRLSVKIPFLVRRGEAAPHQKRNMGGGRRPPPPHRNAVSLEDEWHDHAEGSSQNGIRRCSGVYSCSVSCKPNAGSSGGHMNPITRFAHLTGHLVTTAPQFDRLLGTHPLVHKSW